MKKFKKQRTITFLACLCACVLLFAVCQIGATDGQRYYSWYVRRNAEHKQPVADAHQATLAKYGAYYVDKAHNEQATDKVLYLTFDAGYENGNICKILDVLREKEVSAAFFVLKNMLLKERALVERMEKDGHLICNHTLNHKDTSCMTEEELTHEINGLAELYRKQTGKERAPYYRPPEGKYSEESLRIAQKLGYKTVFWSFAYADWDNDAQPDREKAKEKILQNTHNGAVILLHPTSATNAAILGELIDQWKAEGYRFGTMDELVKGQV